MNKTVVRLVKGDPKNKTVYSSNPVETAKNWEKVGADMLHIVDLDATLGIDSNFQMIKNIAEKVSIPIQVGGGLRTEEMIEDVLDFGSKALAGTNAV